MGCTSSKHKATSAKGDYKSINTYSKGKYNTANVDNSGKPVNFQEREVEDIVADEWLNAIKNENLKEGSLIHPPDDLAKDTNMAITIKNN